MATDLAKRNGSSSRYKRAIVKPSLVYDSYMQRLIDAPTPEKLAAILVNAENGQIDDLCQLQMEMEARCGQIQSLADMRRGAVQCLDWAIEPDQDLIDDAKANEVADYCTQTLVNMRGEDYETPPFETALNHLSTAIGANVAVLENVWSAGELVDIVCVPYKRLTTHPITNRGIAIMTEDEPQGIPTDLMPGKFVVYHRHWNGGFPFRRTLTHATVLPYLFINLSSKDWAAFSELFGQPLRTGTAPEGMKQSERDVLADLLQNLGSDTAAMFPKDTELTFLQAQGTGETYERQLAHAEAKLAILYLGQTLTTEIGQTGGSYNASKVHERVREDIAKGDIKAEADAIRHQLLRPMVELHWPGQKMPVPYFVRKVDRGRDVEGERLTLEQLRFARESGLRMDEEVIYEKLSLPKPETKPKEDEGDEGVTVTFNELTLGIERATALGDLELVNALRSQVARMLNVTMSPLTEIVSPKATANQNPEDEEAPEDGDDKEKT